MKIWILPIVSILLLTFCKSDGGVKKPAKIEALGILNPNEIEDLANKTDYVDFLFYHLNISVSQNDKPSIIQSCHFLTTSAKSPEMNCPSIGRISFQSLGKIVFEADMHLANQCGYFTIIENKKEKGTSLMSPDCIKFLSALVNGYKAQ